MRDLVVLGSSSSEVFDYIFGDNPKYHPFWASGWSARGLRRPQIKGYISKIMALLPRESNVILNFGVVDIDFNSRHKANNGYYDFGQFIREACQGIVSLWNLLADLGFRNCTAIFAAPPVDMPRKYWVELDRWEPMPVTVRAAMMADLANMVSSHIPTINILNILSWVRPFPVLAKEYMRADVQDHHQNYIATQHIIYESLSMPGLINRRYPFHDHIYEHTDVGIAELVQGGRTRPRTCR